MSQQIKYGQEMIGYMLMRFKKKKKIDGNNAPWSSSRMRCSYI